MPRKRLSGPFVVPVRDLVHRPGEMREFDLQVAAPTTWGEGLVAVAEGEPVRVAVRLESVHEGILATADVDTRYTGICGRCLAPLAEPLEVEFQELFGYPGDEAADQHVAEDHLDLETAIRDSIVLSLPFQPVCTPDCAGLDPETGEPKQQDATGTGESIDTRWAALQHFGTDQGDGAPAPRTKTEES